MSWNLEDLEEKAIVSTDPIVTSTEDSKKIIGISPIINEESSEKEVSETKEVLDDETDKEENDDKQFSYNPIINDLINRQVLPELQDEELENLSDDIDGFKAVIDKGIEYKAKQIFDNYTSQLSDSTKRRIEIELMGGNYSEIESEQEDYENADLDDLDNQKYLVSKYLGLTKLPQEKIDKVLQEYEASGTLGINAEIAVEHLKASQEEQIRLKEEAYKKEIQLRKEADALKQAKLQEELRNEILGIETLKGIPVSREETKQLYDFITKVDKDGKTESQKRHTFEDQLLFEYIKMKNIDLKSIQRQAETKATKQLKQNLHRYKAPVVGSKVNEIEDKPKVMARGLWGDND